MGDRGGTDEEAGWVMEVLLRLQKAQRRDGAGLLPAAADRRHADGHGRGGVAVVARSHVVLLADADVRGGWGAGEGDVQGEDGVCDGIWAVRVELHALWTTQCHGAPAATDGHDHGWHTLGVCHHVRGRCQRVQHARLGGAPRALARVLRAAAAGRAAAEAEEVQAGTAASGDAGALGGWGGAATGGGDSRGDHRLRAADDAEAAKAVPGHVLSRGGLPELFCEGGRAAPSGAELEERRQGDVGAAAADGV